MPKQYWLTWKEQKRLKLKEEAGLQRKDPSFLKLQSEWYEKLKQSGFKDLEFIDNNGEPAKNLLREPIANLLRWYSPQNFYYYCKARWFLHNGWFTSKLEQDIWEMHCTGLSSYKIGLKLGKGREFIRVRVNKLKKRLFEDLRYEQMEAKILNDKVKRFNHIVTKVVNKKS